MRDRIVNQLAKEETVLTPKAWEFLEKVDNPTEVIEKMTQKKKDLPFPVCEETISCFLDDVLSEEKESEEEKQDSASSEEIPRSFDIECLKDISGCSTCTGTIDDFKKYFESRFEILKSIVQERREGKKARPISRVSKRSGDATVIAMVREIHSTSNGNKVLTLEDKTGEMRGFISSDSEAYTQNLLEDEVILAKGEVWENNGSYDDTFSIEKIRRPGVPKLNNGKNVDFEGKIAFLGDIHVGSDVFLRDKWDDLVSWINSDDELAEEIKYLLVPGDLIDGIGIFPNQEEELDIIDMNEQYRKSAELLSQIRDDIQIITIPGNHDIVRNAEPQPCLPEDIQELFPSNVHFYGNPSMIELEGLDILMYHGTSINNLSDILPDVTSDKPTTAQKEMLERRHLVPVYGEKSAIAPEEKDYLAIDEVPDIFVTGHIHRTDVEDYHGIVMINSSAWQAQTEYQKMRDIQPDPAKVVVLEPQTKKARIKDFS